MKPEIIPKKQDGAETVGSIRQTEFKNFVVNQTATVRMVNMMRVTNQSWASKVFK
jgi:hypothetical protein